MTTKRVRALNSLMPIAMWIDQHCFLTKKGEIGILLSLAGIHSECINEAITETCSKRVREALKGFTDDYRVFQYIVKNGGAEIPVSDRYPNELAGDAARERKRFLESKTEGLYGSGIYWCLLYKPKKLTSEPERSGISIRLFESRTLRILARDLERNRRTLFLRAKAFIAETSDLLGVQILPSKEATRFFRCLANFDPKLAAAVPVMRDRNVDYSLGSVAMNCYPEGISTSNRFLRVLSMKDTPRFSEPNMFRDLYKIQANFILCLQYEAYSHQESVRQVAHATDHFHNAQWMGSLGQMATMVLNRFSGEDEKKDIVKDEGATDNEKEVSRLSAALNQDDVLGELCFTLIFHDTDPSKLDLAAAEAIRAAGQYEASLFVETYNSRDAYLSIFPGNRFYTRDRAYLMLRSSIADMSFVYRRSNGAMKNEYLGTEYLFVAENSDNEPYYVTTNYNDVNNTYMSGLMGSGKSVLSNKLLEGHLKNGTRLLVLDQGHSYRELCERHGGSYFHFDFERQPFFINPFSLPGTKANIRFLTTFVRLLLRNNGYQPTLDDNRTIWDGINDLYEGAPEKRRLSRVPMRREARLALSNWIEDGEDAWLFDNAEDSVTFSDFQVFEFQGAEEEEMSVFLEPLLFYIFKRWEQIVQDPAILHVQKLLHADEVWKFLFNETVRKKIVAAGKRHRKHNGGLCLVTQSAEDLRRVGLLEVVNELCPTKMWLSNPNADIAEYTRIFGWNEAEAEAFQRLAPKRDVLIKKGERAAELFHVTLSAEELAFAGNDPVGNLKRAKRKKAEGEKAATRAWAAGTA